jgi:hypothetical protein
MIKITDQEKEYSLLDNALLVQDLEDAEDHCQVDFKDFSEFEASVYKFLTEVSK